MSSQASRASTQPKPQVIFRLGVTRKARLLAIFPIVLMLYMAYVGVTTFRSFHPRDSARFAFASPPLLIAATILSVLIILPRRYCRGVVQILDTGVEFNPGDHDLNVLFPWKDMLCSATPGKRPMFRSLILVYRDKKLVLSDLFTYDYDVLQATIQRLKNKVATATLQGGNDVHIDSSRVARRGPSI